MATATPPIAAPSEPGSPALQAAFAAVDALAERVAKALPLTPTQLDALRVVTEMIDTHGYAPTAEELAREMGWVSKGNAWRVLEQIAQKGWIELAHGRKRGITVLRRPPMPDFAEPVFVLADELACT